MLLLVPNICEGRDRDVIAAVAAAYTGAGGVLLDTHSDPDHHRTVHTLAAPEPARIPAILAAGAAAAAGLIDLRDGRGIHPFVGALDVAPVVHLGDDDRGLAVAAALAAAEEIARAACVPVFLYGALAAGRSRSEIRRGGPQGLAARVADGRIAADFGGPGLHPTAGATLVAARAPLVAFNIELSGAATLADARETAATIREGGERGLPGVRAIGLELTHPDGLTLVQISTNIDDHLTTSPRAVIEAVAKHHDVAGAELVGLAPEVALAGLPADLPIRNLRTIEQALAASL